MALKLKFTAREEIPAEQQSLYVERARCAFRIVYGRAVPATDDGRTVLRSADGSRALSVEEWTRQQVETRCRPLSIWSRSIGRARMKG